MRYIIFILIAAFSVSLAGCSDENGGGGSALGAHPANWAATHDSSAAADLDDCRSCHGIELEGSGGAVSCSSCHSFNETPPFNIHPVEWTEPLIDHRGYAVLNGYSSCATSACHGSEKPLPLGGEVGPSCGTASFDGRTCHDGGPSGVPHPLEQSWLLPSGTVETSHAVAAEADAQSCFACHSVEGAGGVDPACMDCHIGADPLAEGVGPCNSCHAAPPDGDVSPNRAGAHTAHVALTAVTCASCHQDAGTGTPAHFDDEMPADVNIASAFDANSGEASYDAGAGTCSNVSCHGGEEAPAWFADTLDVAESCESCHQQGTASGVPEDNSYFSGRHSTHAGPGGWADRFNFDPSCGACHRPAAVAVNHFSGLETPEFEGDPANTLHADLNYDDSVQPPTCTTSCHSETRAWSN